MKVPTLLTTMISGFLLFPVHGFSPASSRTFFPHAPKKTAVLVRGGHHVREDKHGPVPIAASSSSTRHFFTPKSDVETSSDDKPLFIRPALHNSPFFRSLAVLYALLFAIYRSSTAPTANALNKMGKYLVLPPNAAATAHLLSFAVWFGTVVYTTFVAGITMFKNLPRRVFGTLQSKLFPLYFQLCSMMIAVQILTLTAMPDILSKASEVSLGIAFFSTLLNLLYLEPKSTRVMFERYSLEDDGKRESDEYSKLARSFGKLHGLSSLTNLVALCGGVIHGVRLASALSGFGA
eukprot:CAMPEP_0172535322 /NCGR_PEP_ID=MMETSP1067-20121228/7387_1 /TAXON_ID=265564 ORGANISM="Thalassiosira punctigera, Strain Tpunct2005C2" /NCGR_SAMPLE_ID=MMETSP1067 /ASSEMBLY_ACC=CAM_ASM_000444 /LENGTH=291 /DNA_ID=CAMNT_0013320251 /DNA_START=45 /DNA_END=920 /DNA_ORIENTATION=-